VVSGSRGIGIGKRRSRDPAWSRWGPDEANEVNEALRSPSNTTYWTYGPTLFRQKLPSASDRWCLLCRTVALLIRAADPGRGDRCPRER
jgi:hypothetical protein